MRFNAMLAAREQGFEQEGDDKEESKDRQVPEKEDEEAAPLPGVEHSPVAQHAYGYEPHRDRNQHDIS
jgi:hypothetical protein